MIYIKIKPPGLLQINIKLSEYEHHTIESLQLKIFIEIHCREENYSGVWIEKKIFLFSRKSEPVVF